MLRNILKIIGFIIELILIFFLRIFNKKLIFFNNSTNIKFLKYYYFLCKILNIKFIYDYVEFVDSIHNRKIKRINQIKKTSFDFNFYKYVDKSIVISSFLEKHLKSLCQKDILKIPPIIDFKYFNEIDKLIFKRKFLLFCGGIEYEDIINVIDSIEIFDKKCDVIISSISKDKIGLLIGKKGKRINKLRDLIRKELDNKNWRVSIQKLE